MKRAVLQFRQFYSLAVVFLLPAGAGAASATQTVDVQSTSPCSAALHSAAALGQWELDLGPERATTLSIALPANRSVLLEAREMGVDVDLQAAVATVVARTGNPVRRRGLLRLVLQTDQSGRATIEVRATSDGGPGRRVMLRAYDEDAPQTDACRSVARTIADADVAFAKARQVSAGFGPPNAGSAADLYAGASQGYVRAFVGLAPGNLALRAQLAHALATLSCENLEQWRDCETWSAQAAMFYGLAGDIPGRAAAQSLLAVSRMELAQLPNAATAADPVRRDSRVLARLALDQLRRLAAYYLNRGERYEAAVQVNLLGLTLYDMGDYSSALNAYGRAQRLYEGIGERYRLAVVLQNIALVNWDLGRASTALNIYRRALGLVNAVEAPGLFALILNNYGLANRTAGRLDQALALHAQALDLATRIQLGSERGRSLLGIGMVYSAAGDRDLAASFLHQALDTFTQRGEGRDSVSALRALANIAAQDGHQEDAIGLDREALAHATGPIVRAHLLAQIADSESLLGRNQAAADDIELAARIPGAQDSVSHSLAQLERGVLDFRAGRLTEARTLLQATLATDRAFGLDAAAFETDLTLAQVEDASGHPDLALRDLDEALKLSEALRVQTSDPELRATSMQPLRPAFALKIDLLANAYEMATATGDVRSAGRAARAALAVAERSRSRVMRDISLADYTHASQGRVDQLLGRKSRLLADLAAHEDRLEASGVSSMADSRVSTIRADVTHLREQLAVLDSQLASLSRSARDAVHAQAGAMAAPPPDVAIVSYWLGDSDAYAWLQTQSQVRLIDLGSAVPLRVAAEAVHSAYNRPDKAGMTERLHAGSSLSRLALQPVLAQMPAGITRLIIIPDGPLHYVSFAALPMRVDADDSFLIGKYEVAYGSSIAVALAPDNHQTPTRGMLLVADAVYGLDDPRLVRTMTARAPLGASSRLRSALDVTQLERLPATAAEASGIAQMALPLKVDELEGFAATRDAVLSRPLELYRYIHFAVHATSDAEVPQLSSLVLSTYDVDGRERENRIWAGDLMGRRFNARTVVLSACDTALGRNIGGEGLFSLRYVVLARGAQSVVASLWSVPDRTTAALMQNFYQGLLLKNLRPESALALAIRQMLRQGPRDPLFWAPFTATVASLQSRQ